MGQKLAANWPPQSSFNTRAHKNSTALEPKCFVLSPVSWLGLTSEIHISPGLLTARLLSNLYPSNRIRPPGGLYSCTSSKIRSWFSTREMSWSQSWPSHRQRPGGMPSREGWGVWVKKYEDISTLQLCPGYSSIALENLTGNGNTLCLLPIVIGLWRGKVFFYQETNRRYDTTRKMILLTPLVQATDPEESQCSHNLMKINNLQWI